ncbi:hypothetical protein JKP88DRAFT_273072 [Tribonema minus]|uniref:Uncharacterized protein n=1 Tax=Tribonema minus TaxID=303371 RepID=A0A835YZY6_9STRA|nr:hypothetical protein JKP88DRAFT_273072 [Tribonema minus]
MSSAYVIPSSGDDWEGVAPSEMGNRLFISRIETLEQDLSRSRRRASSLVREVSDLTRSLKAQRGSQGDALSSQYRADQLQRKYSRAKTAAKRSADLQRQLEDCIREHEATRVRLANAALIIADLDEELASRADGRGGTKREPAARTEALEGKVRELTAALDLKVAELAEARATAETSLDEKDAGMKSMGDELQSHRDSIADLEALNAELRGRSEKCEAAMKALGADNATLRAELQAASARGRGDGGGGGGSGDSSATERALRTQLEIVRALSDSLEQRTDQLLERYVPKAVLERVQADLDRERHMAEEGMKEAREAAEAERGRVLQGLERESESARACGEFEARAKAADAAEARAASAEQKLADVIQQSAAFKARADALQLVLDACSARLGECEARPTAAQLAQAVSAAASAEEKVAAAQRRLEDCLGRGADGGQDVARDALRRASAAEAAAEGLERRLLAAEALIDTLKRDVVEGGLRNEGAGADRAAALTAQVDALRAAVLAVADNNAALVETLVAGDAPRQVLLQQMTAHAGQLQGMLAQLLQAAIRGDGPPPQPLPPVPAPLEDAVRRMAGDGAGGMTAEKLVSAVEDWHRTHSELNAVVSFHDLDSRARDPAFAEGRGLPEIRTPAVARAQRWHRADQILRTAVLQVEGQRLEVGGEVDDGSVARFASAFMTSRMAQGEEPEALEREVRAGLLQAAPQPVRNQLAGALEALVASRGGRSAFSFYSRMWDASFESFADASAASLAAAARTWAGLGRDLRARLGIPLQVPVDLTVAEAATLIVERADQLVGLQAAVGAEYDCVRNRELSVRRNPAVQSLIVFSGGMASPFTRASQEALLDALGGLAEFADLPASLVNLCEAISGLVAAWPELGAFAAQARDHLAVTLVNGVHGATEEWRLAARVARDEEFTVEALGRAIASGCGTPETRRFLEQHCGDMPGHFVLSRVVLPFVMEVIRILCRFALGFEHLKPEAMDEEEKKPESGKKRLAPDAESDAKPEGRSQRRRRDPCEHVLRVWAEALSRPELMRLDQLVGVTSETARGRQEAEDMMAALLPGAQANALRTPSQRFSAVAGRMLRTSEALARLTVASEDLLLREGYYQHDLDHGQAAPDVDDMTRAVNTAFGETAVRQFTAAAALTGRPATEEKAAEAVGKWTAVAMLPTAPPLRADTPPMEAAEAIRRAALGMVSELAERAAQVGEAGLASAQRLAQHVGHMAEEAESLEEAIRGGTAADGVPVRARMQMARNSAVCTASSKRALERVVRAAYDCVAASGEAIPSPAGQVLKLIVAAVGNPCGLTQDSRQQLEAALQAASGAGADTIAQAVQGLCRAVGGAAPDGPAAEQCVQQMRTDVQMAMAQGLAALHGIVSIHGDVDSEDRTDAAAQELATQRCDGPMMRAVTERIRLDSPELQRGLDLLSSGAMDAYIRALCRARTAAAIAGAADDSEGQERGGVKRKQEHQLDDTVHRPHPSDRELLRNSGEVDFAEPGELQGGDNGAFALGAGVARAGEAAPTHPATAAAALASPADGITISGAALTDLRTGVWRAAALLGNAGATMPMEAPPQLYVEYLGQEVHFLLQQAIRARAEGAALWAALRHALGSEEADGALDHEGAVAMLEAVRRELSQPEGESGPEGGGSTGDRPTLPSLVDALRGIATMGAPAAAAGASLHGIVSALATELRTTKQTVTDCGQASAADMVRWREALGRRALNAQTSADLAEETDGLVQELNACLGEKELLTEQVAGMAGEQRVATSGRTSLEVLGDCRGRAAAARNKLLAINSSLEAALNPGTAHLDLGDSSEPDFDALVSEDGPADVSMDTGDSETTSQRGPRTLMSQTLQRLQAAASLASDLTAELEKYAGPGGGTLSERAKAALATQHEQILRVEQERNEAGGALHLAKLRVAELQGRVRGAAEALRQALAWDVSSLGQEQIDDGHHLDGARDSGVDLVALAIARLQDAKAAYAAMTGQDAMEVEGTEPFMAQAVAKFRRDMTVELAAADAKCEAAIRQAVERAQAEREAAVSQATEQARAEREAAVSQAVEQAGAEREAAVSQATEQARAECETEREATVQQAKAERELAVREAVEQARAECKTSCEATVNEAVEREKADCEVREDVLHATFVGTVKSTAMALRAAHDKATGRALAKGEAKHHQALTEAEAAGLKREQTQLEEMQALKAKCPTLEGFLDSQAKKLLIRRGNQNQHEGALQGELAKAVSAERTATAELSTAQRAFDQALELLPQRKRPAQTPDSEDSDGPSSSQRHRLESSGPDPDSATPVTDRVQRSGSAGGDDWTVDDYADAESGDDDALMHTASSGVPADEA